MTVTVCIPYGGACPHRARALAWVTDRYHELGWQVAIGTADQDGWCKAAAVADALARVDGDVLVIADADCWTPRVERAAWWVGEGHGNWCIPYTTVFRLTEASTDKVVTGDEPTREYAAERIHDGARGGGVVVVRRDTYEQIPLDGRFQGWGGEDFAWGFALTTLAGNPGRLSGLLWHLWHPHAYRREELDGQCSNAANEQLRHRYEAAFRRPDAMRALLEEARCEATRRSPSSAVQDATSTATR